MQVFRDQVSMKPWVIEVTDIKYLKNPVCRAITGITLMFAKLGIKPSFLTVAHLPNAMDALPT